MSNYSIKKNASMGYEEALKKIKGEFLKKGYGVLSELDIKSIFKEKIDKDLKEYTILRLAIRNLHIKELI